jgi:hypothetical protein
MGGEDAKEHLHPLLYLLDAVEALIHSCSYPSWQWLAWLWIASAFGRDPLDFHVSNALHPPLHGHERRFVGVTCSLEGVQSKYGTRLLLIASILDTCTDELLGHWRPSAY